MRAVRGGFDLHRCSEPNAGRLHNQWPEPIPGQRLELNATTGEAAIVEPLYDEKFAALREKIEGMGQKLPPERETFEHVDVDTWTYFMQQLADSGKAKLIAGTFPKLVGKPKTRFHSTETVDPIDKLTAAMEKQNELLTKLLTGNKK